VADDPMTTHDDFEQDPRIARLLGYLREGPLPSPPPCTIQAAKGLMGTQSRPAGMFQQLAETIATLIFDSRTAPALAGFRGGSGEVHLIYQSEGTEVDIHIERPGLSPASRARVVAQVESEGMPHTAHLQRPDRTSIAEVPIDDRGMFAFDVEPGRYDLTITLDDASIRIPSLEL
jgi:hypothetical protein